MTDGGSDRETGFPHLKIGSKVVINQGPRRGHEVEIVDFCVLRDEVGEHYWFALVTHESWGIATESYSIRALSPIMVPSSVKRCPECGNILTEEETKRGLHCVDCLKGHR